MPIPIATFGNNLFGVAEMGNVNFLLKFMYFSKFTHKLNEISTYGNDRAIIL